VEGGGSEVRERRREASRRRDALRVGTWTACTHALHSAGGENGLPRSATDAHLSTCFQNKHRSYFLEVKLFKLN
jgi:hypothetical protein